MATEPEAAAALAQVARLVQYALELAARRHELSPTLAKMLSTLSGRTPTMNELAALLTLDKSSTSGLVDRAERRGLVRRVPSQLDRRAVRIRLTDSGRELQQELDAGLKDDISILLEPLGPEETRALATHLSAILAAQTHR
jgi:DNA-binding MarR family transcriptional regulator